MKHGAWPAQRIEIRPWRQTQRGGSRDDRMLREIVVSLPARIADAPVPIDAELAARLEDAMRDIADLDAARAPVLELLRLLLLCTESVASAKIESVEASLDDYARALHGVRANPSAVSMVAATAALDRLISRHTQGDRTDLDAVNRDDVPALAQAAITYAQFEAIHSLPAATGTSTCSPATVAGT